MISGEYPSNFLSLDRYANLLGFDPIQFFQGITTLRSTQICDDVWMQLAWQGDNKVSREELRQAISQAEADLVLQTGYFPQPTWYTETVPYAQFYQKEYKTAWGYQSGNFAHKTVTASRKYVLYGGARATTEITAANITRNADIDTTGDGFDDTASFTVTIDFTNECELKAYIKTYNAADAANCRTDPGSVGADKYWEIRPIRTTLSGTTATVYIPIYLLFKPQLQRQIDASTLDADVATSYVDTIEFYRVYNDPSAMATFLWANEDTCNDAACAYATQTGCIRVNNSRNGILSVQPSTYAATTSTYTHSVFSQYREPDKVILNYYAGYSDHNTRNCDALSYYWAYTIAMLASARLNKTICTCESPARIIERWQEDVSLSNSLRTYNINPGDLSNPFGTRLGEVLAYNRIKNRGVRVATGINVY